MATPKAPKSNNKSKKGTNLTPKAKKYGRLIVYMVYFASKFLKKLKELDELKEKEIANYKLLAKEIESSIKTRK